MSDPALTSQNARFFPAVKLPAVEVRRRTVAVRVTPPPLGSRTIQKSLSGRRTQGIPRVQIPMRPHATSLQPHLGSRRSLLYRPPPT